jgi:hypothetical protein
MHLHYVKVVVEKKNWRKSTHSQDEENQHTYIIVLCVFTQLDYDIPPTIEKY